MPAKVVVKPYYDIAGFFDKESKRLTEGGVKIRKTVTINNKSESKIIEKPDYEEEFKMFVASDINRPAWIDKYHIKETPYGNHGNSTEYWAKDKRLNTQSLKVEQLYGDVGLIIQIHNIDKSAVTASDSHLYFNKNVSYSIFTTQKLVGSVDSIKIKVDFLFD